MLNLDLIIFTRRIAKSTFPLWQFLLSVLKVRVIEVKPTKLTYKYKLKVEKVLKGDRTFTGKKVRVFCDVLALNRN